MGISRRNFLQLVGASIAAAGIAPESYAASPRRPNIILFMVDDMGWQDTSLAFYVKNGKAVKTTLNKRYQTPNMERMAREGILFTDAYASAICSPTRCSLMSGMNAARHRVTDWTLGINKSKGGRSEGLEAPTWATNGIQPPGTKPSGHCQPPWRFDASGKYVQPKMDYSSSAMAYKMTMPYTNIKSMPQFLHDAGYYTIHCGKAHFGSSSYNKKTDKGSPTPGADPRAMGFDLNIAGSEIGGPGSYRGEMSHKYGQADKQNQQQWWVPGLDENNYYESGTPLTDALTDMSLRALTAHLKQHTTQPFYLYLAHYAVHVPLDNAYAWDCKRSASEDVGKDSKNPKPKDSLPWNATERNYSVLLKGMDDSLGMVMDYLKKNRLDDNTLLIFMSDNGGLDDQGGRMKGANLPLKAGKGSCYEGGIREPMIVRWPGVCKPNTLCQEPVIIEDFFPTILDAAGINIAQLSGLATTPAGVYKDGPLAQVIDGESFLPVLTGKRKTVRKDGSLRPLLWHLPNSWRGSNNKSYDFYSVLRYGMWKLIYQHSDLSFELYNLEKDIGETTDLAKKEPKRVEYLKKLMADTLRERKAQRPTVIATGAPLPWPDEVK